MNHQPFETWLLAEETLPPEQSRALREHLQTCEACQGLERSWSDVAQIFQKPQLAAPVPGFTERWQARLAAERRKRQQRNAWGMLAITGSIALGLLILLGAQSLALFQSPEQLVMYLVYRLVSLYFLAQSSFSNLPEVLRPLIGVLPLAFVPFALGLISILGVLWIVAYQKIMAVWRVRV
jgi:predicted anti-sigma-YlaC factor YlaD